MERNLYTYAVVKSLLDEGQDYIDSFWPFVIKVIHRDRFVDLKFIQAHVKENFDLEIPLHVLKTILNRAKRKNYIEQQRKQYGLLEKGCEYLDKLETDKEVERRINALLIDISKFFNEKNVSLPPQKIYSLLIAFINKNVEPLMEVFAKGRVTLTPSSSGNLNSYEKLLLRYIEIVEKQKPEEFNTLRDIILGSLISTILYLEEPSELLEITQRKFKHLQVFLDTNFVFSILDLHAPEFNEPAKELFKLLKKHHFDLRVFDFTIDEICRVIKGYFKYSYRYPSFIAVDSIYSTLRKKGWTKTDAQEFIINIENILKNMGITIEYTNVSLDEYQPMDNQLKDVIIKWKPQKTLSSQNHDLAAIEKIKEKRGRPVRKIEDAKALFLTSDVVLSKLNFEDMGHKDNGTISEVILDRLMACILWLKNPKVQPPIKSIIAAHSRDLFVKREIWDKFYEVLKQLRKDRKVNDEDISMLFYHNYIEDVLKEMDDADLITDEFVLEKLEEAAKFKEEEVVRTIKEKENEFLKRLKEEISKKEQEKDEEWAKKIDRIKNRLKEIAEKKATRDSIIYSFLLTLLLIAIEVGTYFLFKKHGMVELLLLIFGGGGGILGVWTKFRAFFKERLFNRIIQKLREVELNEEM